MWEITGAYCCRKQAFHQSHWHHDRPFVTYSSISKSSNATLARVHLYNKVYKMMLHQMFTCATQKSDTNTDLRIVCITCKLLGCTISIMRTIMQWRVFLWSSRSWCNTLRQRMRPRGVDCCLNPNKLLLDWKAVRRVWTTQLSYDNIWSTSPGWSHDTHEHDSTYMWWKKCIAWGGW